MKNEAIDYANDWNASADFFYNNGTYKWICSIIKSYKTVFEIGCGTGQSTLSLLENGHKVISIEKNKYCIEKAKILLNSKGYKIAEKESDFYISDVIILNIDLCDQNLYKHINKFSFDIVTCWNIGSDWGKDTVQYYMPYLFEFYSPNCTSEEVINQIIQSDLESSYAEFIIWKSCELSHNKNVPLQLIEREPANQFLVSMDTYYDALKRKFGFCTLKQKIHTFQSLSQTGRQLSVNGKLLTDTVVDINVISYLYKYKWF